MFTYTQITQLQCPTFKHILTEINCIITDKFCSLYFAIVCQHYDPNGVIQSALQTLNYKCYSSWHFSNDITDKVVNLASSPLYGPGWIADYGINGYYGIMTDGFVTAKVNEPWLELDFGQVVQIQKVLTKLHGSTSYPSRFCYVEVRVGNQSGSGDYSSATVLDFYPQVAPREELIVFEGDNPLWGRYLSFQSLDTVNTYFIMGNINVLGVV